MQTISIRSRIGEYISRLKYYLNSHNRKRVNIYDWKTSVDIIARENKSLSRFGDGELLMIYQYINLAISHSTFQDYDPVLGRRLHEILIHPSSESCLIGLPHCMFSKGVDDFKFGARYFWERFSNKWVKTTLNLIKDKEYRFFVDTNMTRFYNDYKNKSNSLKQLKSIKNLWEGRNVLIVEGEKTRFGVGNDLLNNALTVRRILIPQTNAFKKYDDIFKAVKTSYNTDDLVIICAGMTATVLAYDLSFDSIQALDLGHLDIEYEWLKRNANERIKICGKFTNEANDRNIVEDCNDEIYYTQIIEHII